METKRYNGWTNYETWCVNLWLSNEQGDYEYWREAGQEAFERAEIHCPSYNTQSEEARHRLADQLKDEITNAMPISEGMFCDLLGAALCEVDWSEIANAFLEEVEGYEQEKSEPEVQS